MLLVKASLILQRWNFGSEILNASSEGAVHTSPKPRISPGASAGLMQGALLSTQHHGTTMASWDRQLFMAELRAAPEGIFCAHLVQPTVKQMFHNPRPVLDISSDRELGLAAPSTRQHCRQLTLLAEALSSPGRQKQLAKHEKHQPGWPLMALGSVSAVEISPADAASSAIPAAGIINSGVHWTPSSGSERASCVLLFLICVPIPRGSINSRRGCLALWERQQLPQTQKWLCSPGINPVSSQTHNFQTLLLADEKLSLHGVAEQHPTHTHLWL